jgi:hypothetical protein
VTAQQGRSYRIGFLNPWQDKAENQAFQSLAVAARRIGHELVHVANSDLRAAVGAILAFNRRRDPVGLRLADGWATSAGAQATIMSAGE